ncbi:transglycosylase SLT domain-containing protein [Halobacteriovorax sp. JY17]|uniref:transglycosylase SLT domain-containing protein n=1 Tax=Halobacteriovorax sp. JY17 TaxID=2014617 RepID=UPI0025B7BB5B|nr:transglycosylase SLT domain-containing protein [Halobacteriovorax sp. JY17]
MKSLFTFLVLSLSINASAARMNYSSVQKEAKIIIQDEFSSLADYNISDIKNVCPSYDSFSQDERETFFSHLVASITNFESSYNPNTTFGENNGNTSTGLLQISPKSISKLYKNNGCKGATSVEALKDSKTNIRCGLAIMKTWIAKDQVLSSGNKGAARYWSTLRTPYKVYIASVKKTVTVGKLKQVSSLLQKNFPSCK